MDPFARLPNEVICEILASCSDFTSLVGFQQISPAAATAFKGSFKEITESVLKNCPLTSWRLHCFFTCICSMWSNTFARDQFLDILRGILPRRIPPISLSTYTFEAVSHAVNVASKIHLLACACLQHFLNRLNRLQIRRPLASNEDLDNWINLDHPLPGAGDVIEFPVDLPSWIENYRAHEALWILVLQHEMQIAAKTRWMWQAEDRLEDMIRVFPSLIPRAKKGEELYTILKCVWNMRRSKPPIPNPDDPLDIAVPSSSELILQACWPLPNIPDIPEDPRYDDLCRGRAALVSLRISEHALGYLRSRRGHVALKLKIVHPLWKVDSEAFRRLGIPIYDGWRLYQMRLFMPSLPTISPHGKMIGTDEDREVWSPQVSTYIWYNLAEEGDIKGILKPPGLVEI
ncbi:unnamed protein product [Penicillium olsonii]|nr:unnamed protein product [Penicillium olsonii]CAG7925746.1 unnamed protein product [Penicillium olsonii]